jgi:hypothetical protein
MVPNFLGMLFRSSFFQWRAAELLSTLFLVFGLITATIDYEASYSALRTHDNCAENTDFIRRITTLSFTLIGTVLLFLRHILKRKWYNLRPAHNRSKKKGLFTAKLALELLILVIFPYPGLTGSIRYQQSKLPEINEEYDNTTELCYTLSEVLYFLMFFRIFFVVRTLFNFTPYQDAHARTHCANHKTRANVRFSVKSMMEAHPLLLIYFSILPSFVIFAAALRIFERPFSDISGKNYESMQNAVWNSFVTMATVGYGDMYPSTLAGRCVAVACAVWGAYMFSLIVFTMKKSLELNANQARALTEIKITRTAGKVICALARYALEKKKGNTGESEWQTVIAALKRFRFNANRVKILKKHIGVKEYVPKRKLKEIKERLKEMNLAIQWMVDKAAQEK